MKAHIFLPLLLLLLPLAACGGGDDDGGASADGAPQIELTGEDILAKLMDVDGEGSGLDADSIDGLDSADLARAGKRTVTYTAPAIFGNGSQSLPESEGSSMQVAFRVPEDAVPGEPLELRAIGITGSCGLRLIAAANIDTEGEAGAAFDGDMQGTGTATAAVTAVQNVPFEIFATFENAGFVPGAWAFPRFVRDFDDPDDTCTGALQIFAAAIEYQGR